MKFRTDFVTNSSSSSFVILNVTSKTLATIMEKYGELLAEEYFGQAMINGDNVEVYLDECYAELPHNKETIINGLLSAFGVEFYEEDEYESEEEVIEALEDSSPFPELSLEIYKAKEQILEDMETFEMTVSDMGWQGDSDSRYYTDNYDDDTLQMYYEEIAAEKGCNVEDITDEDFGDWVSDKTSTEENRFTYNKKTGEINTSHSFTVE